MTEKEETAGVLQDDQERAHSALQIRYVQMTDFLTRH